MPLWRLFYHLVWATHDRQPLISHAHEQILYPYIKGKADFLECQLHAQETFSKYLSELNWFDKIYFRDILNLETMAENFSQR